MKFVVHISNLYLKVGEIQVVMIMDPGNHLEPVGQFDRFAIKK